MASRDCWIGYTETTEQTGKISKMKKDEVRWRLDDLWPIDNWEKKIESLEKELKVMEKWLAALEPGMSGKDFRKIMMEDEELGDVVARLGMLPGLMEAVNQKDAKAKLWHRKITDLMLKFNLISIRIGRWLKGLPVEGKKMLDEKNAKRLFGAVPEIEDSLNFGWKLKQYSLEEREEDIVDNKDINGLGVLTDLRSLMEAEHQYQWGKSKITQSELMKFVYDRDPKKREKAYRLMLGQHQQEADKSFLIYQAIAKDWLYETKTRGYKSPISMRNVGNRVSDKAVKTLLEVCRDERKIFWRFFEWKARQLKSKKLNRFDLYASLADQGGRAGMNFAEAKKIILETFGNFCPGFRLRAEKIFADQHIDSHPRKFKESGAFCATASPKVAPYIMMNFTGTVRGMATLAHELGHGIHSLYANKQWPSVQHAGLPLAETASTLGEMVVFERMLEAEKNEKQKVMMLADKLTDAYATILRQNYIVMFELEAMKRMTETSISENELSELWLKLLREQLGPGVEVDPLFRYEWAYISHIFNSPFYCYAYNFGELLSLSLFKRYKEEGKGLVTKIEKMLEIGGARDPMEVLGEVEINIEEKKFWQGGFEVLNGWVKELESVK